MRIPLLLFVSASLIAAAPGESRTAADLFRSAENVAIVTSAEKVDICMLYPAKLKDGDDARSRRYDSSAYRLASPAIAAFLRSKLVSDSSYRWSDDRKACMPIWNARLRFTHSGQTVTADLCFGCDMLKLSRDGLVLAVWDFDPASAELFDAVRIVFPKDRVVRDVGRRQDALARSREAMRMAIEAEKANKAPEPAP